MRKWRLEFSGTQELSEDDLDQIIEEIANGKTSGTLVKTIKVRAYIKPNVKNCFGGKAVVPAHRRRART